MRGLMGNALKQKADTQILKDKQRQLNEQRQGDKDLGVFKEVPLKEIALQMKKDQEKALKNQRNRKRDNLAQKV